MKYWRQKTIFTPVTPKVFMKIAPAPHNGQDILLAPQKNSIPETLPDADFNDVVDIVSQLCNTSLVSIIGANNKWSRSVSSIVSSGIEEHLPLINNTAANDNEVFVVPELSNDSQLSGPGLSAKSYIGVKLIDSSGLNIGTLCILGTAPCKVSAAQAKALQALARQIVSRMEFRDCAAQLKRKQAESDMAYADLGKIARLASHDLKSPLNNIISISHLLKEDYAPQFDEDCKEYVDYLGDASLYLSDLVGAVLTYTRTSQMIPEPKEMVSLPAIIEDVTESLDLPENTRINYPKGEKNFFTSRTAFRQILLHLLSNAIRNRSAEPLSIDIAFREDDTSCTLEFRDSGHSVAPEDKERIFGLFEKLNVKVNDKESMGVDLAVARRLVEKLDGTIIAKPEVSIGSSYLLTFPKP